jgi:hypothetical protein
MSVTNEKSTRADLHLSDEELKRFVKRVAEMRDEGLATCDISHALRVGKTTIRDRENRYRQMQKRNGV